MRQIGTGARGRGAATRGEAEVGKGGLSDPEHPWECRRPNQTLMSFLEGEPRAPSRTATCIIAQFPALQCLLVLFSGFFFLFGFLFELFLLWYSLENGKKF